jgi:hypothetical protein
MTARRAEAPAIVLGRIWAVKVANGLLDHVQRLIPEARHVTGVPGTGVEQ